MRSKVEPKRIRNSLGCIPIGPIVVPFWGSYIEYYKVIPKRNYFGAYGVIPGLHRRAAAWGAMRAGRGELAEGPGVSEPGFARRFWFGVWR